MTGSITVSSEILCKRAQNTTVKTHNTFVNHMKKPKVNLLWKILAAIVLGIAAGLAAPVWAIRIFITFNGIFSQFLGFAIPLIITGLVTPAIADIGSKAGKMLLATILIAYISTVTAGFISYFTGAAFFPGIIPGPESAQAYSCHKDVPVPFFSVNIPPLMDVMTALVLSFTVGLGLSAVRNGTLKNAVRDFGEVVTKMINTAIIPLLPLYIFGIFMNMAHTGEVFPVIGLFIKIIGIIFILHIGILLLQFSVAGAIAGKNPFRLLWNMMPAYMTALGTQSSAATIPVTLAQARKNGVSEDVAGFVIPLCSTIHMSGSMLKIVACALALMTMNGMPHTPEMFIGFICMLAITMIAAPGVPGGAIMAALGLLGSMLAFSEDMQALMITLYIAMDSFGTACNVTGDGAIAIAIDRLMRPARHCPEAD